MAAFDIYPGTHGWQGSLGPISLTQAQYASLYLAPPVVWPTFTAKAFASLMLGRAGTRTWEFDEPAPVSLTPPVRFVRRQLQRRGRVGFARLGGRRPL